MGTIKSDLVEAINSFAAAHRMIVHKKWWWYIVATGIVNVILLVSTFTLAIDISNFVVSEVSSFNGIAKYLAQHPILYKLFYIFVILVIRLLILLLYLSCFKYIMLIILSPVLAYLSEQVEAALSGKNYPFHLGQFVRDVFRGVVLSLRNGFIELFLWMVLCILGFIPFLNLLSPVLIFVVASYFAGFAMMDYYNERQRLSIALSISITRMHKWKAIGNGAMFYALFAIPIVGWMAAPIYSVVAATIVRHSFYKNNK